MDTLEPLIEAVRDAVTEAGWTFTGLQKTTSYEYSGAWAGSTTRSAYLFFHPTGEEDGHTPALEVFLDETEEGLKGQLALVVRGPILGEEPDVAGLLDRAVVLSAGALPEGMATPVSASIRHPGRGRARDVACELRFKARLPRPAIEIGAAALGPTLSAVCESFGRILNDSCIQGYMDPEVRP